MAGIDARRVHGAHLGMLALIAGALVACPKEDGSTAQADSSSQTSFSLPDRYNTGEAVVLVRFDGGWTPSNYQAHRTISAMFREQIKDPTLAILRGADGATAAADPLAGSAVDQVGALLKRVLSGGGLYDEASAVDACGNPMIASFVTPEAFATAAAGSVSLPDVLSDDACGAEGGCNTHQTGTWDVILSDVRDDGMVDAFVQIYPAVKRGLPAYLGHLVGFFLTDNNPGFWQAPLFVAADKVQVSLTGLIEKHTSYSDRHYGDAREIYRFPHMERTVSRNDLSVTVLADPLCDLHHDQSFAGELPYGCNLPDGRDLAVQLELGTKSSEAVYEQVLDNGKTSKPLEQVTDALAYQIGAFLACPTFAEPQWVKRDNIELMVCPDGDLDACIGFHDMEQAGCDLANNTWFARTAVSAPGAGVGAAISPSDYPYAVTQAIDELGYGSGPNMELTVSGAAGETLVLYGPALSRLTLKDARGRPMTPVVRPDLHCGGTSGWEWTLPSAGTYGITVSGTSEAVFLLTRPDLHAP